MFSAFKQSLLLLDHAALVHDQASFGQGLLAGDFIGVVVDQRALVDVVRVDRRLGYAPDDGDRPGEHVDDAQDDMLAVGGVAGGQIEVAAAGQEVKKSGAPEAGRFFPVAGGLVDGDAVALEAVEGLFFL